MNHDEQARPHASHAGGVQRMLAALAFLFGAFAAELARPIHCNLLHRPAAQQHVRRPRDAA